MRGLAKRSTRAITNPEPSAQAARKSGTNHMGASVFEGTLQGTPKRKPTFCGGSSKKTTHAHQAKLCVKVKAP